jgi:putative addiction module component (TIGR02574 family)
MITETIPQLRDMRLNDKFQLAVELWDEVLQHEAEIAEPPGLAAMLEQRLTDYRNGQTTGKSWEEVRSAIQVRKQS